jgi:hypothetical protein
MGISFRRNEMFIALEIPHGSWLIFLEEMVYKHFAPNGARKRSAPILSRILESLLFSRQSHQQRKGIFIAYHARAMAFAGEVFDEQHTVW